MNFEKNNLKLFLMIISCLLFHAVLSEGKTLKITNEELLSGLSSDDMETRTIALANLNSNIKKTILTENIIVQILRLAHEEQAGEASPPPDAGELPGDYMTQIIDALGNTKDARAVPYLIGYLGGGTAAADSLNKIGEPAIHPLIDKLHDEVTSYRSDAAYALGLFFNTNADGYSAQGRTKEMIKHALIEALQSPQNAEPKRRHEHHHKHDKDRDRDHDCKENEQTEEEAFAAEAAARAQVRINIVKALVPLAEAGDKEVMHVLQKISEEDEYTVDYSRNKTHRGASATYEVREEAKKVLESLKMSRSRNIRKDK